MNDDPAGEQWAQHASPASMNDPAGKQRAQHAAPLHAPDVLGIDWHTPLEHGWQAGAKAIQGNLDPVSLFAPREVVLKKVDAVLAHASRRPEGTGYIFNLGHGILPKTPVDNVKALVERVHGG
jgi:uroporphyrinogen-III decarboxylase